MPTERLLPVDVVFHPSWWHRHAGIDFDEGFFYDARRRVEDERRMDQVLYERFGDLGLGEDPLAAQGLEDPLEPFAQRFEHARLTPRLGRSQAKS